MLAGLLIYVLHAKVQNLCFIFEARAGCYYSHTNGTDYRDTGQYTANGYRCLSWGDVTVLVDPAEFNVTQYPAAGKSPVGFLKGPLKCKFMHLDFSWNILV